MRWYSIKFPTEVGSETIGVVQLFLQFERLGMTEDEINEVLDLEAGQEFVSKHADIVIQRMRRGP